MGADLGYCRLWTYVASVIKGGYDLSREPSVTSPVSSQAKVVAT